MKKSGKKKNLKVERVSKCLQNYRANLKDHIEKMDSNRARNKTFAHRPRGKRSLGRPLERWSETVAGHLA
jgi:hypothetical protein